MVESIIVQSTTELGKWRKIQDKKEMDVSHYSLFQGRGMQTTFKFHDATNSPHLESLSFPIISNVLLRR